MMMLSQTNINHHAHLIDSMQWSMWGLGEWSNEKGVEVCADDVMAEEVIIEVILLERIC